MKANDCRLGPACPTCARERQVEFDKELRNGAVDFDASRQAWDRMYNKNLITKREYMESLPGLDRMTEKPLEGEWPEDLLDLPKGAPPSQPTPKDLAEEAINLVYGDRNEDYGHPHDDYSRTAELWSALLGVSITAHEAALMMVLLKLSREMNKHKDDNMVDAHGYLLVAGRILAREEGRE